MGLWNSYSPLCDVNQNRTLRQSSQYHSQIEVPQSFLITSAQLLVAALCLCPTECIATSGRESTPLPTYVSNRPSYCCWLPKCPPWVADYSDASVAVAVAASVSVTSSASANVAVGAYIAHNHNKIKQMNATDSTLHCYWLKILIF